MAADELHKAESYANAALPGSSHKSEAGLKLLGDIKLACSSCGPSLKQDMQHQTSTDALETFFTRCAPPAKRACVIASAGIWPSRELSDSA